MNMYKNDIILWGAGNFGLKFYKQFFSQLNRQKPLFWVDEKKKGTKIDGVKVISPDELWKYYNQLNKNSFNITLIITARSVAALQIMADVLRNSFLGKVEFASCIYARKYFSEHSDSVSVIQNMLKDDISKKIYTTLIDNITNGRILDSSLYTEGQYFPNTIIPSFDKDDVIIDAGVCNGEEIDKALAMNAQVKILAFEPNRESFDTMVSKYTEFANVKIYPYALWDKNTKVSGCGESLLSTKFSEKENSYNLVNAVKLDDVVNDKVDYIKMDIEGAEIKALLGAEKTIKKYRPNLAICIYHNIEDYVEIPLLIKQWNLDYDYYIRHHTSSDTETVFYAIRSKKME